MRRNLREPAQVRDLTGAGPMDAKDRERVSKTRELIEGTRREIVQVHAEIQNARATIEHSLKLLARPGGRPDVPALPCKPENAL
jgi:hypothetical protein